MSLANIKTKTQEGLNDIYTALEEKGATIPEQKNLVNVAPTIESITGGDNSGKYVWSKYSDYIKANENIKLLLPFDGNIIDVTGNNIAAAFRGVDNPTTDNQTVYGDGKFGKSFYFDGWNYVEMPYTEDINIDTGDFTIAFWIKPLQLAGIYFNLGKYKDASTCLGMRCGWSGNNTVFCNFTLDENNTTLQLIPITNEALTLTLEEWTHLAIVRKGSTFSFYKNGVKTYTTEYDGGLYNTSSTFQIGARSGWSSDMEWFTNAYIDDFVLAKEALYDGNFTPTKILYEDTGTFEEYVVSDNENAYPNNDYGDDGFYYIKEIDKQEPEQPQVHNYLMLYDGTLGEAGTTGANVCRSATGGYEVNPSIKTGCTAAPISFNSDHIYIDCKTYERTMGVIATTNTFNLNGYTKYGIVMKIVSTGLSSYSWLNGTFATSKAWNGDRTLTLYGRGDFPSGVKKLVTKDISSISSTTNNYFHAYFSDEGSRSSNTVLEAYVYEMFLVKQDNWQKLCEIVGLTSSDYASESTLCSNSTAISTILNNKDAVNYMIYNCTGSFLLAFIQSGTSLKILNSSNYRGLIYGNNVWFKFLSMVA